MVRAMLYVHQFDAILGKLKDRINLGRINDQDYLGDDEGAVELYYGLKTLNGYVDDKIVLVLSPREYKLVVELMDDI